MSRTASGYGGTRCTATLVDPSWVLTVAHCVDGDDAWRVPEDVWFYLGADARPGEGGALPEGRLVQVDAVRIHPEFSGGDHDAALLHLVEPVSDVAPLLPSEQNLKVWANAWSEPEPPEFLVVGFGATEGVDMTGFGFKRSATLTLDGVGPRIFFSDFAGKGVCGGDSGAPALLELAPGEGPQLVGMAATIQGCPASDPDCDPCRSDVHFLRLDVEAEWLAETLATGFDCNVHTTLCGCPEACTEGGTCDPSVVCPEADCEETYQCVRLCVGDATCEAACRAAADDAAVTELEALLACAGASCDGLGSWAAYVCRQQACAVPFEACFDHPPFGTGDATCEEVSYCIDTCPPSSACYDDCLGTGSAEVQVAYAAMADCIVGACSDEVTAETYESCVVFECHESFRACYPSATGDMGCGFVDECRRACPTDDDGVCRKACYTQGTADAQRLYDALRWCEAHACEGAPDPMACRLASCGDEDRACYTQGEGGSCEGGEPCATGLVCQGGMCVVPCVDADDDGVCAPDDCADDDPATAPDATEVCDNDHDDDCDGTTDEGCSVDAPTPTPASGDDGGCGGGGAPSGLVVLAAAALALGLARRRTYDRPAR